MVRILALGPLAIERDGTPTRLPRSTHSQRLIALLTLANREMSRDEVFEALWPGDDPQSRANSLDQAVKKARHSLHETEARRRIEREKASAYGGGSLRLELADDVSTDVREQDALIAGGNFADAIALHRGEIQPGEQHPWLQAFREQQRASLRQCLLRTGTTPDAAEAEIDRVLYLGGPAYVRGLDKRPSHSSCQELVSTIVNGYAEIRRLAVYREDYLRMSTRDRQETVRAWITARNDLADSVAALERRLSEGLVAGGSYDGPGEAILQLRVLADRELRYLTSAHVLTPFGALPQEPNWAELDRISSHVDTGN